MKNTSSTTVRGRRPKRLFLEGKKLRLCPFRAVEFLTEYAFGTMNLQKLKAGTDRENARSARLFRNLGWKLEGTLKRELYREGRYRDALLFAVYRDGNR